MVAEKLHRICLEMMNVALGSQVVSVKIPLVSMFSSVMEEDTCLLFNFLIMGLICLPQTSEFCLWYAYPQRNLLPSKSGTEEASAPNLIILLLDILLIYQVSDLARKIQDQFDFNIWNLQMIDCLFSPNTDLLNLEDFKCCQVILSNTCILMTYCALKSTKWFYTHNTINPYNDNEWLLFCFFNL